MRIAAVLLLVACAVHRPRGEVVPAKDQPVTWKDGYRGTGPKGPFTCGLEKETGSQLMQQVCRYDNDDSGEQARREQLQQELNKPRGTNGAPGM